MFNREKVLKMIHVNLVNFYDETSKSLNQFCLLRPSAFICYPSWWLHNIGTVVLCDTNFSGVAYHLSRQIKWTLCNILEVVALFWIQTRPIYNWMFPLISLSDFTAWSLITWLANPKKTLLRKQLLATLKLSNGNTPAVLLVQHQHIISRTHF